MIKITFLLIALTFNMHNSQESCIKTSHIGDLVVQETAIFIAAEKVPLPATIRREQGKKNEFLFTAPKTEDPIGHIDQWEFG